MPSPAMAVEDLVREILVRLPPISVVRFRAVCKAWLSLMSSPNFIADHTRRCRRHPISGLLFQTGSWTHAACSIDGHSSIVLPDPSLSFVKRYNRSLSFVKRYNVFRHMDGDYIGKDGFDEDDLAKALQYISNQHYCFHLWGCSNGLVFCVTTDNYIFLQQWGIEIPSNCYVANPTTMECKEVPGSGMVSILGAGLLFDPSSSPYYRLVCFGSGRNKPWEVVSYYVFGTYSSKTEAWDFSERSSDNRYQIYGKGVSWNGMMNWVHQSSDELLSYDPDSQLVHTASLPVVPDGSHRKFLYFGESRGRLLLVEKQNCRPIGEAELSFHIMEMAQDRSGWSLLYHVDLVGMADLFPGVYVKRKRYIRQIEEFEFLQLWPVLVVLGEKAGEDVLLLGIPEKIISYNLSDKTFRVVGTVPPATTPNWLQMIQSSYVAPVIHTLSPL